MTEDVFGRFFPGLVKSIHVKLPNEAIDVPMTEIFRQDNFFKFINVLDGKFFSIGEPLDDPSMFIALPS